MRKTENRYFIFDRPMNLTFRHFVKTVLSLPLRLAYRARLALVRPRKTSPKKYKVSVCAIFKNEAQYLKEWIEWHKIVGVEHFYLYNNNSDDSYEEVLAPYIKDGTVTLVQWPRNQAQMQAYQDGIEKFGSETEWLSFIDIDEFIVPNSTDSIYEFLKPFQKKRPVVVAYWKMFGTSGKLSRDMDGLVTEDLTVSWRKYTDIGKIFYNTAFAFDKNDRRNTALHHCAWGKSGFFAVPPVNVFGKMCVFGKNPVPRGADPSHFPLQINHYFTKTYGEYLKKCAKGDVYFKVNPHDEAYFYRHEKENQSVDFSAYKYLIRLKLAMKKEF